MKVAVFDPLFSRQGHFSRYNKYILQLLSGLDDVTDVIYVACNAEGEEYSRVSNKIKILEVESSLQDFQVAFLGAAAPVQKLMIYWRFFRFYRTILKRIREEHVDLMFFSSNGELPFWMAVRSLKAPFIVSAISTRWIYSSGAKRLFYVAYKMFLKAALMVLVTEDMYKKQVEAIGVRCVRTLHDRYLPDRNSLPAPTVSARVVNEKLRLVTLGTISAEKNPLDFIDLLTKADIQTLGLTYEIHGKALDQTGQAVAHLVKSIPNVHFDDSYLDEATYEHLMSVADVIVLPYSSRYTKFMTSGVMWDCIERAKPILCTDIEPFGYYISRYKIGFTYNARNLSLVLHQLAAQKGECALSHISSNYARLWSENGYSQRLETLSRYLQQLKI